MPTLIVLADSSSRTPDPLWSLFDLSSLPVLGLQAFLGTTLERVAVVFGASGATIFLDNGDGVFGLVAKTGALAQIPLGAVIEVDYGLAGHAIATRKSLIVDDRVAENVAGRHRADVASALIVPLMNGDAAVGVLNLSRGGDEAAFGPDDLAKAEAVAHTIALAITNAKLVAQTQAALQEAQNRHETLRGVLDSVGSAVMVIDRDNQILDRNKRSDEMLASVAKTEDFKEAVQQMTSLSRQGEALRTAKVYDSRSDRTWTMHAVPLSDGSTVLTIEEITDFVRSQSEIGRVRRLAEIGQMTAAIAHEIRNPLTGIRSAGQMIQSSPDLAEELGAVVMEEAERLNKLCDNFLDFARPVHLEVRPASLIAIAQRVERLEAPSFAEEGKHLVFRYEGETPLILLDDHRVEQVMLNLVRNAREASAPDQLVEVTIRSTGFSVADHGVGMTSEQQSMLFSPFFTTKPHGTGLGLTNVRKIVDAHGGTLSVKSAPGEGTAFEVSFSRRSA